MDMVSAILIIEIIAFVQVLTAWYVVNEIEKKIDTVIEMLKKIDERLH